MTYINDAPAATVGGLGGRAARTVGERGSCRMRPPPRRARMSPLASARATRMPAAHTPTRRTSPPPRPRSCRRCSRTCAWATTCACLASCARSKPAPRCAFRATRRGQSRTSTRCAGTQQAHSEPRMLARATRRQRAAPPPCHPNPHYGLPLQLPRRSRTTSCRSSSSACTSTRARPRQGPWQRRRRWGVARATARACRHCAPRRPPTRTAARVRATAHACLPACSPARPAPGHAAACRIGCLPPSAQPPRCPHPAGRWARAGHGCARGGAARRARGTAGPAGAAAEAACDGGAWRANSVCWLL